MLRLFLISKIWKFCELWILWKIRLLTTTYLNLFESLMRSRAWMRARWGLSSLQIWRSRLRLEDLNPKPVWEDPYILTRHPATTYLNLSFFFSFFPALTWKITGTVSVISGNLPCQDGNAWFTTVPFKAKSDQIWIRNQCL